MGTGRPPTSKLKRPTVRASPGRVACKAKEKLWSEALAISLIEFKNMFELEKMVMQYEEGNNMARASYTELLEAAGGYNKLVDLYIRARRQKDAKMMARIRKFAGAYIGAPNGLWAADILKQLDAIDCESTKQRRGRNKPSL